MGNTPRAEAGRTLRASFFGAPLGPHVLTLVLTALAAVIWSRWSIGLAPHHQVRFALPLFVVAFSVAVSFPISFEVRRETLSISFVGAVLVFGFSVASARDLGIGFVLAAAFVCVVRDRQSATKVLFNLANEALAVAAAATTYFGVLAHAPAASPHGWLAALSAYAVLSTVEFSSIIAVIMLATRRRVTAAPMAMSAAVTTAIGTALAVILTVVGEANPTALLVLVLPVIGFAAGGRAHHSLRLRYANLGLLYGFTRRCSGLVELEEMLPAVLREARDLLRAELAEASVTFGDRTVTATSRDGSDELTVTTQPPGLETLAASVDGNVLVPRNRRDDRYAPMLEERGMRDLIAVPLPGMDEDSGGVLMVANRLGNLSTFDGDDLQLLAALASHAAAALRNSELLQRLREEAAEKEHQALHDALTELPNRTLFAERLTQSVDALRDGRVVAVLLMDLDGFKVINDTLGHHIGDLVLEECAARLRTVASRSGTVARLGGDEFAVILDEIDSVDGAIREAQQIRTALEQPLRVEELTLEVGVSIGIAMAPLDGRDAALLLQRADIAMYEAKGSQTGVELYAPERDALSARRLALVSDLRHAIETDSLELWFQPQADIRSSEIIGVEALLRWTHPRFGFVPPDEFIPVAEQSGLIRPLTIWVIERAVAQLATWANAGYELGMAVNLSARNLLDAELADIIARTLSDAGVAPSLLTVEITETHMMTDLTRSAGILAQLSGLGVRVSVDDFGTGYSSLSRLKRLPVVEVKIDKSFVLQMCSDAYDEAIVRSTTELAHNLGLTVVAEGVEDQPTWDRLALLGCDVVQGYFLAKPMPAADLELFLARREVGPAAPVTAGPALSRVTA